MKTTIAFILFSSFLAFAARINQGNTVIAQTFPRLFEKTGAELIPASNDEGNLSRFSRIDAYPRYFLIDMQGRIISNKTGWEILNTK